MHDTLSRRAALRTAPLLLAALAACGGAGNSPDGAVPVDAADATVDRPTDVVAAPGCESVGELCHEVDPGSGPLHDCHNGGHDAQPAWCAANAARCRMLCEEAHRARDAGTDGARVDAADAASDASHAAIGCELLGSYCHTVDPGSGPLHDCHEGAHGATPTWCAANAVRCYALCNHARANDGGLPDGAVDAGASTPEGVACRLLGSYCHAVDPGSGPLHDCHEGAHAAQAAWCSANVARCYALCRAARAADAGVDAARD